MSLKKLDSLPYIKKNVNLADHSWFRIGGPADYFAELSGERDMLELLEAADTDKIPVFVLGGGSNLLFDDKGFRGVMLKVKNDHLSILGDEIKAGAGLELRKLLKAAAENNLVGSEGLYGIPGTVGGAIRGNVGAHGCEIEDYLKSVRYATFDGQIMEITNKACGFRYRHSIFKEISSVILEGIFQFIEGDGRKSLIKMSEYEKMRLQKHPVKMTAGCFFKNPENSALSAARLIEQAGLKGKRYGGAQISPQHANFIINTGNAKSDDIISLAGIIKEEVLKSTGILLKEEVQIVPEVFSNKL